jgi:hypothetical protein
VSLNTAGNLSIVKIGGLLTEESWNVHIRFHCEGGRRCCVPKDLRGTPFHAIVPERWHQICVLTMMS